MCRYRCWGQERERGSTHQLAKTKKKKKKAIDRTDGGHEATNDVERKNPFRRRVLLVIQLPTRGGLILLPGIVCLRAVGGFSLSLSLSLLSCVCGLRSFLPGLGLEA